MLAPSVAWTWWKVCNLLCKKKDKKGFSWSNLAELGKVEGCDLLGFLDLLLVGFDLLLKAFDQPLHAFVVLAVLKRIVIDHCII